MSPSWKEFHNTGKISAAGDVPKMGLLVVDDEEDIVASLRAVFTETFEVFHASSAPEALELFKKHAVGVIISDQRMPDMTGLEFLRAVKEINPDTVRLLVTGYSDLNIVVEALNEGLVWKYVEKPWDHDALRSLVHEGAAQYLKQTQQDPKMYGMRGFLGV